MRPKAPSAPTMLTYVGFREYSNGPSVIITRAAWWWATGVFFSTKQSSDVIRNHKFPASSAQPAARTTAGPTRPWGAMGSPPASSLYQGMAPATKQIKSTFGKISTWQAVSSEAALGVRGDCAGAA
eukprot:CAMPEP_0204051092 /NCGR_PEP_ID=MMETSP0360-20130528/121727_1 /ASSEMBLY_ACC=CAM_ASM_000342 /TAXON_ID=268821 /ORGANISM="Scrippsiella Hangoei, Strain SHTV-5" /LENGTH=125 /DNA_ID=CAMNT_0050998101 /DNA_START=102 /DNA_END=476 /DNA_ORIENTATION=+